MQQDTSRRSDSSKCMLQRLTCLQTCKELDPPYRGRHSMVQQMSSIGSLSLGRAPKGVSASSMHPLSHAAYG